MKEQVNKRGISSERGSMGQSLATAKAATKTSKTQGKDETMRDFLLYSSPTTDKNRLLEAIHALYYLPQNFKLVLADNADVTDRDFTLWDTQNIMDRVRFGNKTETSQETSPFLNADAILTDDDQDPALAQAHMPLVVVKDTPELGQNDHRGFNIPAGNPEAFASAMLHLARARA